jgi:adenylosuccinate synthase
VLKDYRIISQQDRLEGELYGVKIAGYIDYKVNSVDSYYYLDLKTVAKCPHILTRGDRKGMLPSNKKANIRQQVIYSKLSGLDTALLFVDEEGNSLHYPLQEQDFIEHEPIIEEAIKKIKKLLTLPIEDVIIETYPKNMNSFFWCDTTRKKAREIWKIKEKKIF